MRTWFQSSQIDPSAIVANVAVPFGSADEVASWSATPDETPSATPGAILVGGRVYAYDNTDTVSVHDGRWTLVSADGRRFKASDLPLVTAVESASVTTPPAITSSIFGKAWIVPAAATGAWAGLTGNIAVASGRGWIYITPKLGMVLYVVSLGFFAHFDAAGDWMTGVGKPSPGTVGADTLVWPFGLIVENTTTNTPPTAAGTRAYIIGSAPTGAWAGRANQLAIGPDGGWSYIAPAEGAQVWDKARSTTVRYSAGAWTTDSGQLSAIRRAADASALTLASNNYTYTAATAPTTANTASAGLSLTHAVRSAGNVVRLWFRFSASVTTAAASTVALFIDGAAVASQWLPVTVLTTASTIEVEFIVITSDTLPHEYSIRLGASAGSPANRHLFLEEASVLS